MAFGQVADTRITLWDTFAPTVTNNPGSAVCVCYSGDGREAIFWNGYGATGKIFQEFHARRQRRILQVCHPLSLHAAACTMVGLDLVSKSRPLSGGKKLKVKETRRETTVIRMCIILLRVSQANHTAECFIRIFNQASWTRCYAEPGPCEESYDLSNFISSLIRGACVYIGVQITFFSTTESFCAIFTHLVKLQKWAQTISKASLSAKAN